MTTPVPPSQWKTDVRALRIDWNRRKFFDSTLSPQQTCIISPSFVWEKEGGKKKHSFQRETGKGSDPFITNCSALPSYPRLEKFCRHSPVKLALNATLGTTEVLAAGMVLSQVLELMTAAAVWQTEQAIRWSAVKRTPLLCLPGPHWTSCPSQVLHYPIYSSFRANVAEGKYVDVRDRERRLANEKYIYIYSLSWQVEFTVSKKKKRV